MSFKIIILCGGSGVRLWPESRKSLPKQFIPIYNKKSLFDLTLERVKYLKSDLKPIVVCNNKHSFLVKESLLKYKIDAEILLEPEGKNTTAAIYLAAKMSDPEDNLMIMPSDHIIPDTKQFANDTNKILNEINLVSWITLGVKPTKPSDAYGYIKVTKNKNNLLKVLKFVEKPNITDASKMINSGNYYWNAGIFFGKTLSIVNSINKYANKVSKACDKVYETKTVSKMTSEVKFCPKLFSKIPSISIDYAVMEKEPNISLCPLNCQWSDMGSWDSVAEDSNTTKSSDKILQLDSYNNYIRTDNKVIATIGVDNLIIINNDDATLIAKKNETEKVKSVVDILIKNGVSEGFEHSFENRPWGKFENLMITDYCKVKKLQVSPGKRLSLQYHNFRSEHWVVVEGCATIRLNEKLFKLESGMSIDIPQKAHHYIHNETNNNLIIIEIQMGSYFGEDDIIRIEDPYNR